jgi:hypothetical protein
MSAERRFRGTFDEPEAPEEVFELLRDEPVPEVTAAAVLALRGLAVTSAARALIRDAEEPPSDSHGLYSIPLESWRAFRLVVEGEP